MIYQARRINIWWFVAGLMAAPCGLQCQRPCANVEGMIRAQLRPVATDTIIVYVDSSSVFPGASFYVGRRDPPTLAPDDARPDWASVVRVGEECLPANTTPELEAVWGLLGPVQLPDSETAVHATTTLLSMTKSTYSWLSPGAADNLIRSGMWPDTSALRMVHSPVAVMSADSVVVELYSMGHLAVQLWRFAILRDKRVRVADSVIARHVGRM